MYSAESTQQNSGRSRVIYFPIPTLIALVSLFGCLLLSELGRLDQSSYILQGSKQHQRTKCCWDNNEARLGSRRNLRGVERDYWITISLMRPTCCDG